MGKPKRFFVIGDFDTLIDSKRINNWALVEGDKPDNIKCVFIQFKYLDKEHVSVKCSNVNLIKRYLITRKLKKISDSMDFYKI